MAEVSTTDYQRGQRLVWIVIAITFGYEVLSILFYSIATLQMFGVLILPINLDLFVRVILEAILLFCVYKGYGWARWIIGILLALGALLGSLGLLQMFSAGPGIYLQGGQQFVVVGGMILLLTMIVAYAAGAIIMLGSASVRVFQEAQRS